MRMHKYKKGESDMKRRNKITQVTAFCMASMMALSGCGGAEAKGTAEKGSEKTENGVPTLSVAVQMNEKGEYSDKNYAIKWIEDQMNEMCIRDRDCSLRQSLFGTVCFLRVTYFIMRRHVPKQG